MWNVTHETYPTIGVESFNQLALHLGAKLWNILKFHFLYLAHSYRKKNYDFNEKIELKLHFLRTKRLVRNE